MNDQDDTDRTAAQLRAALRAAADVMVTKRAAEPQRMHHVRRDQRARGRLFPLAAAACVVVIALATVVIAHLVSPAGKPAAASAGSQTGSQQTTQATPGGPRPEFYLTATYPASGPNVLQFQVRRTDGGAVTASTSIPGNVSWGGYLSVAAGDRAFYIGEYQCIGTAIPRTTFYRITITGSGRISSVAPAGRPVEGMVTTLAVSPDGSRMAYSALQHACGVRMPSLKALFKGAGSVNVTDLSTGTVRTWQDASSQDTVSRLSWAQDGRTLIVDENPTGRQHLDLTVFGLDTTSGGGSLQAHSTTLLRQTSNCSTCVRTALAGPNGSLTVLEVEAAGLHARVSVVSIPSTGGSRTVLFSGDLYDTGHIDLFADPSGQWVLLWPTSAAGTPSTGGPLPPSPAGWISGGRLHPLPGVAQVFPQGIAW
jgi:hypothetical protein